MTFISFALAFSRNYFQNQERAYLRACILNAVRNKIRANQVRNYVELSQAGPIASQQNGSDQWAILEEESMRISNALVRIPFEQREVVVLHLHGGMKFREIAKLQAVSTKTIQSRYRYGLSKLRSILNGEIEE